MELKVYFISPPLETEVFLLHIANYKENIRINKNSVLTVYI